MPPFPSAALLLIAMAPPAQAVPECSARPVIAGVEVLREEVFDDEAGGLYRIANGLHMATREAVVRRELLFAEGDRLHAEDLDQTERNLRAMPFLREVAIEVRDREGALLAAAGTPDLRELVCSEAAPEAVVVRVTTRDSWSTSIEGRLSRAGDRTTWGIGLSESNFLGRGKEIELGHRVELDRTSDEVVYRDRRLAGGPLTLEASYADQSDGSRAGIRLGLPVRELDAGFAWSAGSEAFDQIQPIYERGDRVRELRHVRRRHGAIGSWPVARGDARALRVEAGVRSWYDAVAGNERRFDIVQVGLARTVHRYREISHVHHERPEDLNLGAVSRVAVGLAPAWRADTDAALFLEATHRQGFELGGGGYLVGSVAWSGRWQDAAMRDGNLRARLLLLRFLGARRVAVVSAELRDLLRPDPERQLLLGADTGLRGYPVNEFTGERMLLATAELRWFVSDDLLRLVSLGVVGFADVGATWRAPARATTEGARADVGIGLLLGRRSLSTRNATLRVDLAYALDPVPGRSRWVLSFRPATLEF